MACLVGFFAVVEAIAAAPIVALGIAHPEGSEVFGRADPGVLILTNVFLRPSLMIFGFMISIIFTYVFMWLFLEGYNHVMSIAAEPLSGLAALLGGIFVLIIITSVLMELVNKAFSLVHILPDMIMRWIGGSPEQYAGEAMKPLQQMGGAVRGAGQAAGEALKAMPSAQYEGMDKKAVKGALKGGLARGIASKAERKTQAGISRGREDAIKKDIKESKPGRAASWAGGKVKSGAKKLWGKIRGGGNP